MTTGRPGLLEQGQRRRIHRGSRTVLLDYRPEEAASSCRRAVGTAGPFQGLLADREQRTPPMTPLGTQYLQGTTGRTDLPEGDAQEGETEPQPEVIMIQTSS